MQCELYISFDLLCDTVFQRLGRFNRGPAEGEKSTDMLSPFLICLALITGTLVQENQQQKKTEAAPTSILR
jgi:hypothetical protein